MGNIYLIAGYFTTILFLIFALLLNRDKLLPQKTTSTPTKRRLKILSALVLLFQFMGVALVFIGFALKFGLVEQPHEALGLLKNALIFIVPGLLVGYYLLRKSASRINSDHTS